MWPQLCGRAVTWLGTLLYLSTGTHQREQVAVAGNLSWAGMGWMAGEDREVGKYLQRYFGSSEFFTSIAGAPGP